MERERDLHSNARQPRKKDVGLRLAQDRVIATNLNIHELPSDSSGYAATYVNAADEGRQTLDKEKLESEGYAVIPWDGRCVACRPFDTCANPV